MPETAVAVAEGRGAGLPPEVAPGALDEATTARVEKLIEEEEGAQNRFAGLLGWAATGVALAMALFHLWAAWSIVPTTTLRFVHVGFALSKIDEEEAALTLTQIERLGGDVLSGEVDSFTTSRIE